MRFAWRLVPWVLIPVILMLSLADRATLTGKIGVLGDQLSEAHTATEKYQALYAEAATRVQPSVDTVVRRIDRVKVQRDTLLQHITDTVLVREYVAETDAALKACSDLANLCQLYKQRADALIHSQQYELDGLRRLNVAALQRVERAQRFTIAALLVGGVLGAWVRGQ